MFQRKQLAIRRWIFPEFQLRLPLQCTKITVQGMLLYSLYSLWRTRANPAWARARLSRINAFNFYFCSNLARSWQKSDYICLVNCTTKLQSKISKGILLIQTYATFTVTLNPEIQTLNRVWLPWAKRGEWNGICVEYNTCTTLSYYLYLGLKSNSRLNWISSRHSQVWPICLLDLIVKNTILLFFFLFFFSRKNPLYIYDIIPQSSYTLIFFKKKKSILQLSWNRYSLFPRSLFILFLKDIWKYSWWKTGFNVSFIPCL